MKSTGEIEKVREQRKKKEVWEKLQEMKEDENYKKKEDMTMDELIMFVTVSML